MSSLYLENGYLNVQKVLSYGLPFNFIVGGRGTGKTFGSLQYVLESDIKFILMRRTQTQIDLISDNDFNPFKSLNKYFHWNIGTKKITKYIGGVYDCNENEKMGGNALGYLIALSTVSRIRGFDASDVNIIIYDEFIPESHERSLTEEGSALFNAYETINRNREMNGEKPVQLLALSNSNTLENEIFIDLGIVNIAYNMQQNNKEIYINRERGLGLFMLRESQISEQKSDTALYRLTGTKSRFSQMSLNNDFNIDNISRIKSMPLKEYRLLVTIGEISIYKHKSSGEFYCSSHKSGQAPEFNTSEADKKRMKKYYYYLNIAYLQNHIIFETPICEILFNKLIFC